MPKVSVIIPTYNHSQFIKEAVDSVLNQTYRDFELVVMDDGSTDNTREILKQYGERVRYIYQENKGRGAARNSGIREAKGELIAFLDSDDIWFSEKLERQVGYIIRNRFEGLLHTKMVVIDEAGKVLDKATKKMDAYYLFCSRRRYRYSELLKCSCLFLSSVLLPKVIFEKVGRFNEKYTIREDLDFILRLATRAPIELLNEKLILYRQHKDNSYLQDPRLTSEEYIAIYKGQLAELNNITNLRERRCAERNILKVLIGFSYELKDDNSARLWSRQLIAKYPFELFSMSQIKNEIKLLHRKQLGQNLAV